MSRNNPLPGRGVLAGKLNTDKLPEQLIREMRDGSTPPSAATLDELLLAFNPTGFHFEVNVHPMDHPPMFEVDVFSEGQRVGWGQASSLTSAIATALQQSRMNNPSAGITPTP